VSYRRVVACCGGSVWKLRPCGDCDSLTLTLSGVSVSSLLKFGPKFTAIGYAPYRECDHYAWSRAGLDFDINGSFLLDYDPWSHRYSATLGAGYLHVGESNDGVTPNSPYSVDEFVVWAELSGYATSSRILTVGTTRTSSTPSSYSVFNCLGDMESLWGLAGSGAPDLFLGWFAWPGWPSYSCDDYRNGVVVPNVRTTDGVVWDRDSHHIIVTRRLAYGGTAVITPGGAGRCPGGKPVYVTNPQFAVLEGGVTAIQEPQGKVCYSVTRATPAELAADPTIVTLDDSLVRNLYNYGTCEACCRGV